MKPQGTSYFLADALLSRCATAREAAMLVAFVTIMVTVSAQCAYWLNPTESLSGQSPSGSCRSSAAHTTLYYIDT